MKSAGLTGFLFLLGPLFGQIPSVVTSLGYSNPKPVPVAPGQVITLFARTQTQLTQPIVADGSPLPDLGGFSVSLSQTYSHDSISVPILSVAPVNSCAAVVPAACAASTAITVQIPFELVPNVERSRLPANFATLTISDGGSPGEPDRPQRSKRSNSYIEFLRYSAEPAVRPLQAGVSACRRHTGVFRKPRHGRRTYHATGLWIRICG